jgi:hypothetical protein
MMVGNIATLRPLFRHLLHLGSEDSSSPAQSHSKGISGGSALPKLSHPYKTFGHDYELGTVLGKGEEGVLETQIRGGDGRRGSLDSDSESQKRILDTDNKHRRYSRSQGIVVSQQVEITRE